MKQKLRVFCTLLLLAVASVGWADVYQKYSGEITEGDYIIVYNVNAMKAEVSSNRLGYATTYNSNLDQHTVTDGTIVWTIQADGDYYTLYNANKQQYAASTGTKNQAKLEASVSDKSRWTITEKNGTYEFVNKANAENKINANLRNNGTYGFACYATSTGGALTLYKKVEAAGPVDVIITFGENFQVEVGKTATNTITGKPDDLTLTFASDNTSIATVDESTGAVTGVAEGTATITASWAAVENKYNAGSVNYTVNVIPEKQAVIFEKVTNANQLVVGNEYILVATGNNVAMGAQNETKYRSGVDVTVENDQVAITDQAVAVLTLGGTTDAWTFKSADNSKYLGLTANDNNLFSVDDTETEENHAVWSISNDFQLVNNGYSDVRYIRYNSASPRFACYKSGQQTAVLFMKQGGTVDTKAEPKFSFGETTSFTVNAGADFTAPTLTTAEGYDGTVTYSSSDEDMAVVDAATGEVVIGDKAGTVTITASAPATDNFLAGEASYTITVVKPLSIAEFVALADNTEAILNFDAAQVVYKNGDNMYVRDGNDAINLYQSNLTWGLGALVAGTLNAKKGSYKETPQATDISVIDIETLDPETVTATSSTVADAKNHVNDLVSFTFSNVTKSGSYYYATAGADKVQLYDKFKVEGIDFSALEDGKEYQVTGIVIMYNSTVEICPTEAITEVVDEREEAGIAFNPETLTITEGEEFTQPTFVNDNNLTVSFESDNEEVAMWDDNENELVLMDGIGTAVITATFEGNESYKPATATLTVTVKEDINFVDVVEGCGIYQKITSASDLEAGKRYLIVYENEDKAVIYNGQNGTNSYAGKVDGDISGNKIDNTSVKAAPIVLQRAGSNNWYLMDGDNFLYWNSGNTLEWTENVTESDTWTIDVENGQIINAEETTRRLQYNTGSPRFACYTGTQKDVVLYKELMEAPQPETVTATITAAGYATFANENAVDFSAETGLTVMTAQYDAATGKINYTTVESKKVSASTAVVLKGEAKEYTGTVIDEAPELENNDLQVNLSESFNSDGTQYCLAKKNDVVGFYKVKAGVAVKAGKAYLVITDAGAKDFYGMDDETDGIRQIENGELTIENSVVYDLSGRKINEVSGRHGSLPLPKGIYIVNGKKVVVK